MTEIAFVRMRLVARSGENSLRLLLVLPCQSTRRGKSAGHAAIVAHTRCITRFRFSSPSYAMLDAATISFAAAHVPFLLPSHFIATARSSAAADTRLARHYIAIGVRRDDSKAKMGFPYYFIGASNAFITEAKMRMHLRRASSADEAWCRRKRAAFAGVIDARARWPMPWLGLHYLQGHATPSQLAARVLRAVRISTPKPFGFIAIWPLAWSPATMP